MVATAYGGLIGATDPCVLVVVGDREEEGAVRVAIGSGVADPRRTCVPANDFAVVQAYDSDGGAFVVAVGVKCA